MGGTLYKITIAVDLPVEVGFFEGYLALQALFPLAILGVGIILDFGAQYVFPPIQTCRSRFLFCIELCVLVIVFLVGMSCCGLSNVNC